MQQIIMVGEARWKTARLDKRVLAYILDYLAAIFISLLPLLGLQALNQNDQILNAISLLGFFLIFLAYWTIPTRLLGATPFKWLLGLRVIKISGTLTYLDVFFREFIGLTGSKILGAGYLVILFTKNRQALHDMALNTIVVERKTAFLP